MFETIVTVFSVLWSHWTIIFGVILYVLYKWSTATYDFFEKKNVIYEKPYPFVGNFKEFIFQMESVFDMSKRLHLKYKNHKFVGFFQFRSPTLVVIDPEIIKQVTVKDFENFLNHRLVTNDVDPLFTLSLINLQNQKWKEMRSTMSPAFTGSKMRLMFEFINECSKNASQYLKSEAQTVSPIEVDCKDLFTRYGTDVVATCAFGIRTNSLEEKDNDFYKKSRVATNLSSMAFKFLLLITFPRLSKFLEITIFSKEYTKYFYSLVLDAMQQRTAQGIVRPDMIHLLMEARAGVLNATDADKSDSQDQFAELQEPELIQKKVKHNWTDDELVAQCFVFFLAGFDTSSVLMCFCAHELMENPDVQEKLIHEIDRVREELGEKPLTYEVLNKMKYFDMVISETLRKWPPNAVTDRVCNKECTIGDLQGEHVKMQPGDHVSIVIAGLHHDPEHFPDPSRFDPERFSDENKQKIKPFTYLPFGTGPRHCIGSRFAIMQSKTILFHLLSEFTFEASPKSPIPMVLSAGTQLQPKKGFWLNFRPRRTE